MAIQHLYTLLGEYAVMGKDGKTSVCGIYHNIQSQTWPAAKQPFAAVVAFTGDEGDTYSLTLDKPDGECLADMGEGTVTVPAELQPYQQWAVTGVFSGAAVFEKPGVYHISLRSEGQIVHQYAIGVYSLAEAEVAANG